MKTTTKLAVLTAGLLAFSSAASAATIYEYERGAGVFGGDSGLAFDSINASYNAETQDFLWEVDYAGAAADGGWLVVSPGPNPKGTDDELAIAYFDAQTTNVWVYAYNGQNNPNSYLDTTFLGFFAGAYTTVGDVATLSFNATDINAALETGVAFGERIGTWFHPSANVGVLGNSDGLSVFNANRNGYFDTTGDGDCNDPNTGCITTQVPEPGTIPLLLLGVALMGVARRARNTIG